MRVTTLRKLQDQLLRHEGTRLVAYLDTEGVWTIGVGHTGIVPSRGVKPYRGMRIGRSEANRMFADDLAAIMDDCTQYGNIARALEEISACRRAVIYNMAFNMGAPRLSKFRRMMIALGDTHPADYDRAAEEMIDSVWWRKLDKLGSDRAHELVKQMRTNRWAR